MSEGEIKAIPTTYKGINFRSRLEAKWARFFDLMGWPYEYEPVDFDGYIPDFVLMFHKPLYVEVKPVFTSDEVFAKTSKAGALADEIESDVLILGATIGYTNDRRTYYQHGSKFNLGWFQHCVTSSCWEGETISGAEFMNCQYCNSISTYPARGCYTCMKCGEWHKYYLRSDKWTPENSNTVIGNWSKAGNVVQYHKILNVRF